MRPERREGRGARASRSHWLADSTLATLTAKIRSSKSEIRKKSEARSPNRFFVVISRVALFLTARRHPLRASDFGIQVNRGKDLGNCRAQLEPMTKLLAGGETVKHFVLAILAALGFK